MIDRGATTIWETWKESDNVYSNCHPMFGSVSEWYFRWLAGIRPDPDNPGFRKFFISPILPADLAYVKCSYQSPFGLIKSDWEKSKKGTQFKVTVPPGTTATFRIPAAKNTVVNIENLDNNKITFQKTTGTVFETDLSEGNYLIKL